MSTASDAGGRLQLLVDVLRSFADATTDYARLLETIVERVASFTGHATTVRLLSANGMTLETAAIFDPSGDDALAQLAKAPIPVVPALRQALDAARAFVQVPAKKTVDEVHPSGAASAFGMKTVLVAPLVARGKAIGCLFVIWRNSDGDGDFTTDDIELVDALARHAALALANARLITELDSIERAREHERSILDTVPSPLVLVNRTGRIIGANRAFLEAFAVDENDALGAPILTVAGGALDFPALRARLDELPPENAESAESAEEVQVQLTTASGPRTYLVRTKKTVRPGNASETMLVTLLDVSDRLAASKIARRHTLLFSSSSEAIVGVDTNFVIEEWNPAAERLFGWSAAEVRGKRSADLFTSVGGVDRDKTREMLLTGWAVRSRMRIKNRAGAWLDLENSTTPLVDRGKATGFVSVMVDVTERLRLERELLQRVEQLTTANQDLESFSYSVSHDLRAPVRAIDGFSEILQEEHAAALDEEGLRFLGLVRKNAKRMGILIDDILSLSRSGRQPLVERVVDMEELAKGALDDLLRLESGRKITISSAAPLPPAWGDPGLLHQVWCNLYSNAVKYTRGRAEAIIETTAKETEAEVVYSVKDNGAGFDMRYADKLFGTFERLHSPREFEGTGIGLALVARIVKRLGGRAWGEGEVDRGATFHIALPKPEQKGTRA